VRRVLRFVARYACRAGFAVGLRLSGARATYILDIDNTLADTWPELSRAGTVALSRPAFVLRLQMFPRARRLVRWLTRRGAHVVFVTSRSLRVYRSTRAWLIANGIRPAWHSLVLVDSPKEKLWYVKRVLASGRRCVYVDDLSYNHEHGDIRFYQDTIDSAIRTGARYCGYEEIKKLFEITH